MIELLTRWTIVDFMEPLILEHVQIIFDRSSKNNMAFYILFQFWNGKTLKWYGINFSKLSIAKLISYFWNMLL